jgi:hypothetical protein
MTFQWFLFILYACKNSMITKAVLKFSTAGVSSTNIYFQQHVNQTYATSFICSGTLLRGA